MNIEKLRKLAGKEEIDYSFLVSVLSNYASPRDKISEWLKSGELIRVKKGLYIFGENIALIPYSKEILANLIYGPSAVSLNYALSFYGFIPERVHTITSITNKRNKEFTTSIGQFTYKYLSPNKYSVGIELIKTSNNHNFLMASPEKALCDYIYLIDKKIILNDFQEIESYLISDLRIDENALQSLHINTLLKISKIYQDERLNLLIKFLKKWKKQ